MKIFFGIVALIVIIGFSITACDDGGGGGGGSTDTVTYTGAKDGTTYTLKITQTGARYTAQFGDAYELTAGAKKSTGKVDAVSSSVLTLKPTNANTTFKANISGDKLTGFNGSVKWDGESTETNLPTDLTTGGGVDPVNPVPGGTFNSIADFAAWYKSASATTKDKPYNVNLNVNELGGDVGTNGSAGYTILFTSSYNIYVILDLSGSSLTTIPNSAFFLCEGLRGITLPDSVTSIGDKAFESSGLTSIMIPNNVTSIGSIAFSGCTDLTRITIPNSVTSIGNWAFSGSGLTSITIPDSMTSIGEMVFALCGSLTNVTIPNSVTSIGNGSFDACGRLTSVTIPNSVTKIGYNAFRNCEALMNITIPDSVTSIGSCAFGGCRSLTSITIPDSVTSIGEQSFYGCNNLTSVTFQGTISSVNFSNLVSFNGDLREKYLAGGIGTYTTTAPVNRDSVWTKQ